MPLLLASPFDRMLEPAPAEPTPPQPFPEPALALLPPDVVRKIEPRQDLADLWFILVKAGAWLGAIYLMVLGLPLLFLLALAGGNLDLVFLQLGNLAAHYQSADPVSRVAFNRGMVLTLFGLATLTTIWRLPSFLDRVDTDLSGAKQ